MNYLVQMLNANILGLLIETEQMLLLVGHGAFKFLSGVIID